VGGRAVLTGLCLVAGGHLACASGPVEDALRIHTQACVRHGVKAVREFTPTPPIAPDPHRVLRLLVNFLSNAKYACDEDGTAEKRVTVRVERCGPDRVRFEVSDNGVGIRPENLNRIFTYGLKTRRTGHGFELHSGALAARALGATLTARSDGAGKGASFALELPLQPPQRDEPMTQPRPVTSPSNGRESGALEPNRRLPHGWNTILNSRRTFSRTGTFQGLRLSGRSG